MKAREFDLYFCLDEDGSISPYDCSICENNEKWVEGSWWAEPNVHVIEYSEYEKMKKICLELAEALGEITVWATKVHEMPSYSEVIANAKEALVKVREVVGEK